MTIKKLYLERRDSIERAGFVAILAFITFNLGFIVGGNANRTGRLIFPPTKTPSFLYNSVDVTPEYLFLFDVQSNLAVFLAVSYIIIVFTPMLLDIDSRNDA
jgi:hypothetical protein